MGFLIGECFASKVMVYGSLVSAFKAAVLGDAAVWFTELSFVLVLVIFIMVTGDSAHLIFAFR